MSSWRGFPKGQSTEEGQVSAKRRRSFEEKSRGSCQGREEEDEGPSPSLVQEEGAGMEVRK